MNAYIAAICHAATPARTPLSAAPSIFFFFFMFAAADDDIAADLPDPVFLTNAVL